MRTFGRILGSKAALAFFTCVLFCVGAMVWLLARKHPIGSDISPDGAFRADYSYRIRGPVELLLGPRINPRLVLEIVDVKTGKVVSAEEALGDYVELSEVRQCFERSVPWTSKEQ